LYLKVQTVPRKNWHITISVIITTQLMLNVEVIAVSSKMQTKYTDTLCWKKLGLLDVKPGGTYA